MRLLAMTPWSAGMSESIRRESIVITPYFSESTVKRDAEAEEPPSCGTENAGNPSLSFVAGLFASDDGSDLLGALDAEEVGGADEVGVGDDDGAADDDLSDVGDASDDSVMDGDGSEGSAEPFPCDRRNSEGRA
ncbi:MAG: hypothetical protein E6534_10615 [Corynebacterium kroppenstedtii]|nr:hypothetical protein [Corynebacterium kroppenstedtii]